MFLAHALVVEDDADAASMLAALVAREGHTVATAHSIADARRQMALRSPDIMLLDVQLPDGTGLDMMDEPELLKDVEVVFITGHASLETSIRALRLGAADYLVKPVNLQHLRGLLSRMARPSTLEAKLREMRSVSARTGRFGLLIGTSAPMQDVYDQISRVATTAVTVLIQGESGTGKELVARAVHELGRRKNEPFLAVNCGALSPHLIESEIFGHEKGSFTGAERLHRGFFERAHGGTLFLDEVTEMPLELQVKLLRVLETGTFMRVGSTSLQQTDVRIIAATNRDPEAAAASGRLREDLLYRLNVFPIVLPPLRARGEDILLIARHFLDELAKQEGELKALGEDAERALLAHAWPGNVRELRNAVQRAWLMSPGSTLLAQWLPRPAAAVPAAPEKAGVRSLARPASGEAEQIQIPVGTTLAEAERRLILATYAKCGRSKERTAALLGISLKTLYNRLRAYGREQNSS